MKILLSGGGTGGHFYPLIAVAEAINDIVKEEKLLPPSLYFMGPGEYDKEKLFENGITFIKVSAGKRRIYFSFLNFLDYFRTFFGVIHAVLSMFSIYPDVVFAKGGYASFPALFAAKILGIPVVLHESDSSPGRVNKWAGKFARSVALSFPEAAADFPEGKTAFSGQPIRKAIIIPSESGAYEFLELDQSVPVIFVISGSQGAEIINDILVDSLPELLSKYQIIHQTGAAHLEDIEKRVSVSLSPEARRRYKPFGYLNDLAMRMSSGVASLVVSRAGSTIFEIASWGLPSIVIPIANSHGGHQRKNAFNYARAGAAEVIEEKNLSPHILIAEIDRLMADEKGRAKMAEAAKSFSKPDAARKIAKEILAIALEHEK